MMKKKIKCIFAAACLVITAGCASNTAAGSTAAALPQNTAAQISEGTKAEGSKTQGTKAEGTKAEASKAEVSKAEVSITKQEADVTTDIGEESAKAIALKHAGLTGTEVTYIKVKRDYDDGCTVYDIEFYVDGTEYDYEIDAYTGAVRSYDYDIDNFTGSLPPGSDSSHIGLDEAKAIALNKAGLTAEQVTYTKAYLEYDDGAAVYQIEFVSGGMEYELEINAATGAVLEYDAESQYN